MVLQRCQHEQQKQITLEIYWRLIKLKHHSVSKRQLFDYTTTEKYQEAFCGQAYPLSPSPFQFFFFFFFALAPTFAQ